MSPPCLAKGRGGEGRFNARQRGQIAQAKALCAQCPVLDDCTAWALGGLDDPALEMIAAGLTPNQRFHIRNGRSRERNLVWLSS